MAAIVIYRKDTGNTPPKVNKATLESLALNLKVRARVSRPSLVDLFVPANGSTRSAFYNLPALPSAVIKDPAERLISHRSDGWIVPVDSLGRKVAAGEEVQGSQAESIRLWISQNLAAVVNPEDFAVVWERRISQDGSLTI